MHPSVLPVLLGWVLLTSVSTWECHDMTCQPLRSGVSQVTQRVGHFSTYEACTAMRIHLESQARVRVQQAGGRTVEKRVSATCVRETP